MPMLGSRGQSLEQPTNNQEIVDNCMKSYASLNKVTASYRQLVLCVGGTSDSTRLREDLEDFRNRGFDLSTGLQNKLMSLLTEEEVGGNERAQLERMFVVFLSTLEQYKHDLSKDQYLSQLFPLQARRRCLINTGAIGKSSELAWRPRSVKLPSGRSVDLSDEQHSSDIARQIELVGRMLHEMEMKVSVPVWTVEATEETWPEVKSTGELEDGSTNEILTAEETINRGCCAHTQAWSAHPCLIS